MSKRTQKKKNTIRRNRSLRRNNKRSIKKIQNKQKSKRSKRTSSKRSKRSKRVQKGGFTLGFGGGDIVTLLEVLLSKDIITVLPTSQIFDYKRIDRYINMVDFATLKDIVLENDFKKSPTIQKIFNYTSEELQDPGKIKLVAENVNCENLINDRNQYVNKLFLYLFECNKDVFIKENVDWFKVCCGLEEFDDTFEYKVMKNLIEMGIYIKKMKLLKKLNY